MSSTSPPLMMWRAATAFSGLEGSAAIASAGTRSAAARSAARSE